MFDLLKSRVGQATAFADGLVKLDALNMDRMREEQERAERSKEESIRLLRGSEDSLDSTSFAANNIRGGHDGKRASLADSDEGAGQLERHISSSTSLAGDEMFDTMLDADAGTGRGSLELPVLDDGSNFEDEFDPILASIRKPQKKEPAVNAKAFRAGASGKCAPQAQPFPVRGDQEGALPSSPSPKDDASETNRGAPNARSAFSAGFLSILPGSMRARAGDVMAQSSAQISRSANAFRSALENGAPSALDSRKRRQSDPPRPANGAAELEEGMVGKGAGGSRRATGGRGGGEVDDVRLVSADELLSEEERQQLAAFSEAAGGAAVGGFCLWRRLRKWMVLVAAIALVGVPIYLWRWIALTVAGEGNVVTAVGVD